MTTATALKQLHKDAEFLGITIAQLIEFIKASPLAQTERTLCAYSVLESEGSV